jgi:hypothetical protein
LKLGPPSPGQVPSHKFASALHKPHRRLGQKTSLSNVITFCDVQQTPLIRSSHDINICLAPVNRNCHYPSEIPLHRCLFVERPCSALQESPSLESLSSLLDGSTFPQRRSYAVNEAIGPTSSSRTTSPCTRSLFEFCRTAHPDGPFTPVR